MNINNSEEIVFKGKSGGELRLQAYGRPILFDMRLGELLGEPAADSSPQSQLLHWTRAGLIVVAEGLRPGRTDIPARPGFDEPVSAWWTYADSLADLFTGWGLTEAALLRVRKVSDARTDWGQELDNEGKD